MIFTVSHYVLQTDWKTVDPDRIKFLQIISNLILNQWLIYDRNVSRLLFSGHKGHQNWSKKQNSDRYNSHKDTVMWKVQEEGAVIVTGLCQTCFTSGVDVITHEKNPEAACEKCKEHWNIFKIS